VEADVFSEIASHAGSGSPSLVYQPQVQYPGGEVVGLEALFRWRADTAPRRHSPTTFLPRLSPSQTSELFFWVVDEAVSEARVLSNWTGWRGSMAVNIEADQLGDPELVRRIEQVLQRNQWPAARLVMEVTERRPIPVFPSVLRNITAMQQAGIVIAMDDFGEGYASFEYLKRLNPAHIKIPAGFTSDLKTDERNLEIVRALVALAQRLKVQVVAEGVESPEIAEALHGLGVRTMQGYLFGEPREIEDWAQFLKQRGRSPSG
jgi:EAL domain-containing protein (putative c-di-GMP-specific phosphodiesterase class I)